MVVAGAVLWVWAGLAAAQTGPRIIQAHEYDGSSGTVASNAAAPDYTSIGGIGAGDWVRFDGVDLGSGPDVVMVFLAAGAGDVGDRIEFRLDSVSGTKVAELTIASTGGNQVFSEQYASVSGVSGVHDLYLVFPSATGANVDWFVFSMNPDGETESERIERIKWWRDARFGQFIHWGAYSHLAGSYGGVTLPLDTLGEWIMDKLSISVNNYEADAAVPFNPTSFDAETWAEVAKDAGQKYVVITAKHHDGFSMFDTNVRGFETKSPSITPTRDYDIVDVGSYGSDPIAELAAATRAQGLRFGLYYSIKDWHFTHLDAGYLPAMKEQLRELVEKYDPALLWFDAESAEFWTRSVGEAAYKYLRVLKPDVVINDRVVKRQFSTHGDGDYDTTAEREDPRDPSVVDWENSQTMNLTWGYKANDNQWKPTSQYLEELASVTSRNGNYLLNIGPDGTGTIPSASVTRLEAVGDWLAVNGAAIYGTDKPNPLKDSKPSWGWYTTKGQTVYAIVKDWPADGELELENLYSNVTGVASLSSPGTTYSTSTTGRWVTVTGLPTAAPSPHLSVLELTVEPSVYFERTEFAVDEGAVRLAWVRLGTVRQAADAVTVPVVVGAGSAGADDFTVAGNVTFEPGEARKSVRVEASHDDLVEGRETVTLEFGTLPDGIGAGSTTASRATIRDADQAEISFVVQPAQVAEGGEASLVFAITNGVTFERDQTIDFTVAGTATSGSDFEVRDAAGRVLSSPYTTTFPAGAASATVTVAALDDTVMEPVAETVTVSAGLNIASPGFTRTDRIQLGTQTVTIPPSDLPDTPTVTVAAGGSAITEGQDAVFTLSRDASSSVPLTSALTVRVRATATQATLVAPPVTVTFGAGSNAATLRVTTLDDNVVAGDGAVTLLVLASTSNPAVYVAGAVNSATVAVADNDTAAFRVTASSSSVTEGSSTIVRVETVNVTFAAPQTLTLTVGGTAEPGVDFTITDRSGRDLTTARQLQLPAGATSTNLFLRATADNEQDPGETVEISITHDSRIGVVQFTITERDKPPPPPPPPPVISGPGGGGGPAAVVEIDGSPYAAAGVEAVFAAAVSDGTAIRAFEWTVTGPGGFTTTSNETRFGFVAPAGGAHTVSVTVEDTSGRTHTGRITVTVYGDIAHHQFVNEILWLGRTGITRGCATYSFCPGDPVTRAQMASFLTRALRLQAPTTPAGFTDVEPTGAHAANIEALYTARITTGCAQQPLQYCPDQPITRAHMAAFLHRARNLIRTAASSTPTPVTYRFAPTPAGRQ